MLSLENRIKVNQCVLNVKVSGAFDHHFFVAFELATAFPSIVEFSDALAPSFVSKYIVILL
jgi:hypothetical protein